MMHASFCKLARQDAFDGCAKRHGFATDGDIPLNVDGVLGKPPKLRDLRAALAKICRATTL